MVAVTTESEKFKVEMIECLFGKGMHFDFQTPEMELSANAKVLMKEIKNVKAMNFIFKLLRAQNVPI